MKMDSFDEVLILQMMKMHAVAVIYLNVPLKAEGFAANLESF
jgi:hypothetical protein